MGKLKNPRHEIIAQERAKGATLEDCAEKAGMAPIAATACRVLSNVKVRRRVDEIQDQALGRTLKTLEEDYLALENVGHSNLADFFVLDEDGLPTITLENVTREQAAALADISVDTINGKDGEKSCVIGKRVKIKLESKSQALVKLIELKEKALARQAQDDASTIDGTTTRDDTQDYLDDIGKRFALKSLEDARAMKAGLPSPSGNGRGPTTIEGTTSKIRSDEDDGDSGPTQH